MISCPPGKVNCMNVLLSYGRSLNEMEDWKQLRRQVVGYLEKKGIVVADDIDLIEEILEDIIAPKVSLWSDAMKIRDQILWKARFSHDPHYTCLRELRREVLSRINQLRYSQHQHKIYRQVARWAVSLDNQGVLQSYLLRMGRKRAVKIVGLKAWGTKWRDRHPVVTSEAVKALLPMIPLYRGEEKEDRESKIFDYTCLENYEPMILEEYGGPMSLGQMAQVVEGLLSPQPYDRFRESIWPETLWAEFEEGGSAPSKEAMMACADVTYDDDFVTRDVAEQLRKKLTSEEQSVFKGLASSKSKRELAVLSRCSPGTIEKRRLQLEAKAASLDPVVAIIRSRHLTRQKT
jgi:hypothetical protein